AWPWNGSRPQPASTARPAALALRTNWRRLWWPGTRLIDTPVVGGIVARRPGGVKANVRRGTRLAWKRENSTGRRTGAARKAQGYGRRQARQRGNRGRGGRRGVPGVRGADRSVRRRGYGGPDRAPGARARGRGRGRAAGAAGRRRLTALRAGRARRGRGGRGGAARRRAGGAGGA